MKKFFFCLTTLAGLGAAASQAAAQQSPYAGRPTATSAMRPTNTTYAAQPVNYQFKPVNPPSQTTQRILMPSRTGGVKTAMNQPTPAPAAVGAPAVAPQAPAAAPQQYWNSGPGAQAWIPAGSAGPVPDANVAGPVDGGYAGPVDGGYGGDCCGGRGGCCLGGLRGRLLCIPIGTTGDLVQHTPFFGTTHGYYYFRPYHVMHVFSQQELATRGGGGARNPYDNSMFTRLYEQMGVEARPEAKTGTTGAAVYAAPNYAAPEYVVPNGQYVPPAVPGYGPTPGGAMPSYGPPAGNPIPQGFPGGVVPGVEYLPPR